MHSALSNGQSEPVTPGQAIRLMQSDEDSMPVLEAMTSSHYTNGGDQVSKSADPFVAEHPLDLINGMFHWTVEPNAESGSA